MSTPRQLPILFTGPNVRAIMDDLKGQTRRVVRPQPKTGRADDGIAGEVYRMSGMLHRLHRPRGRNQEAAGWLVARPLPCPYGQPGDLLYVRETWAPWQRGDASPVNGFPHDPQVSYRADDEDPDVPHEFLWEPFRWRPSIHMPKKLARLWLRVTDVRVERLQEISEEDAKAEGVNGGCLVCGEIAPCGCDDPQPDHRDAFAGLWNEINEKRGHPWFANDWVWAISFERCEAPA